MNDPTEKSNRDAEFLSTQPECSDTGKNNLEIAKIGLPVSQQFRIESLLGSGSFGEVWLATENLTGRRVAIKKLHDKHFNSPQHRQSLLNEARKVAALEHPNITTLYQAVETDNHCFLVMQYVDGTTLRTMIENESPFPGPVVKAIVRDIAAGLMHAHSKGICHLDIKPANILINSQGSAVITDFGLAIHEFERRKIGTRGTVSYMAPEQIRGETEQFDGRTDIWALGAITYEMLTGSRPFVASGTGSSLEELSREICEVEPQPPTLRNPDVHLAFDFVCKKCLSKTISQRYDSAQALVNDLEFNDSAGSSFSSDNLEIKTRSQAFSYGCLLMSATATAILLVAIGVARPKVLNILFDLLKKIL